MLGMQFFRGILRRRSSHEIMAKNVGRGSSTRAHRRPTARVYAQPFSEGLCFAPIIGRCATMARMRELFDLVIQNGTVVNADGAVQADVGICERRIAAVGPDLRGVETLDATGLLVIPAGSIRTCTCSIRRAHTGWCRATTG